MSPGKAIALSCLIIFGTIFAFTLFINLVVKVEHPYNLMITLPISGFLGWNIQGLALKLEGKRDGSQA